VEVGALRALGALWGGWAAYCEKEEEELFEHGWVVGWVGERLVFFSYGGDFAAED
jgi:hypothetical protein